jgi:hypothetical protein
MPKPKPAEPFWIACISAMGPPLYLISHGYWWLAVGAIGVAALLIGTAAAIEWRRRDPEAEPRKVQVIIQRRLSGLPDREQ